MYCFYSILYSNVLKKKLLSQQEVYEKEEVDLKDFPFVLFLSLWNVA